MILTEIPIFITARGHTKKVFDINKEALKYSYIFAKEQNIFNQTYIISDNEEMIEYAKKLGFIKTIYHPCKTLKEVMFLEYIATYTYGKENNYYPDWIIILNINQLFKTNELIVDCINNISNHYDIVASYTEISDKSHFFIKDNNIVNKDNLVHILSSEAKREKMIDAAIYAIKAKFAFECMEYDDPSEHFWKCGRIKYFKNRCLYTDIYDMTNIKVFNNVYNIMKKIKELNV